MPKEKRAQVFARELVRVLEFQRIQRMNGYSGQSDVDMLRRYRTHLFQKTLQRQDEDTWTVDGTTVDFVNAAILRASCATSDPDGPSTSR